MSKAVKVTQFRLEPDGSTTLADLQALLNAALAAGFDLTTPVLVLERGVVVRKVDQVQ